jgi:hypothetical protein
VAGLSNIFGGDNQQSNSDGNIDTGSVADLGNTVGLDASSDQEQSSTDDDGSSESSSNSNDLSFDSGTDSLLANVTDAFGSTEESSN